MRGRDIHSIIADAEADLASAFALQQARERENTRRVLKAFAENAVAQRHFAGTTGYGYDDAGRDTLERVFAMALGGEDALVRPGIASGTHALATCLFGLTRPGDVILSATGKPYDTLEPVLGLTAAAGSLREWGVGYRQVDLVGDGDADSGEERAAGSGVDRAVGTGADRASGTGAERAAGTGVDRAVMDADAIPEAAAGTDPKGAVQGADPAGTGAESASVGGVDLPALREALRDPAVRLVTIQRSRGYAWRASLSVAQIGRIIAAIRAVRPDVRILVDNCYGEFVETREPAMVGADVMAGSLIKNPGGGIAPTGGYIVGRREAISQIEARLVAPGIGREVGSYAPGYAAFYQGLFLAPHVVTQAVQVAMLAARVFELLGFAVQPASRAPRTDIIQAVRLESRERLLAFCRAVQAGSPVDASAVPEPYPMPGYADEVIMAAGTFVQGASIEWSADAPVKPPYIAYLQGGLTYAHGVLGLERVLEALRELEN